MATRIAEPEVVGAAWVCNPARVPYRCRTFGVLREHGDARTCPLWHETPGSYKPGDYGWRPPQHRTEACS